MQCIIYLCSDFEDISKVDDNADNCQPPALYYHLDEKCNTVRKAELILNKTMVMHLSYTIFSEILYKIKFPDHII